MERCHKESPRGVYYVWYVHAFTSFVLAHVIKDTGKFGNSDMEGEQLS